MKKLRIIINTILFILFAFPEQTFAGHHGGRAHTYHAGRGRAFHGRSSGWGRRRYRGGYGWRARSGWAGWQSRWGYGWRANNWIWRSGPYGLAWWHPTCGWMYYRGGYGWWNPCMRVWRPRPIFLIY